MSLPRNVEITPFGCIHGIETSNEEPSFSVSGYAVMWKEDLPVRSYPNCMRAGRRIEIRFGVGSRKQERGRRKEGEGSGKMGVEMWDEGEVIQTHV